MSGVVPPLPLDLQEIRAQLGSGHAILDERFDAHLPEDLRRVSSRHWTSVAVSLRVARWLEGAGVGHVLDVGSGAGKFCVIAALASRMTFTGFDHRPHLVAAAADLARRFGVSDRAAFEARGMDEAAFPEAGALYFYNPFGENLFSPADHLDATVEINRRRFDRDAAKAEAWLERVPLGTHLVTLNGFGGRVPDTFDLVRAEGTDIALLRHWRKTRRRLSGGYWIELEASTVLRQPGDREQVFLPEDPESSVAP